MPTALRSWCLALVLLGAAGGLASSAAAAAAAAGDQRLFIYNWSDFIGTKTLRNFQQLTGIQVVLDTYDAEETMEAVSYTHLTLPTILRV